MDCYNCGQPLTSDDVCASCGANIKAYRIAVKASNAYYNIGLRKAQVRDLTGAKESLVLSISLNKTNVDARNLLGLVLLEMGNTVEALSQWVISKNVQPEKNIATKYISKIQGNQNKFEAITKSIQKYNRALEYAKEGNKDMALIQLKKVVTVNPKFIKAQLLLAVLYIMDKEYGKARKILKTVLTIDKNNTQALQYMREIYLIESSDKDVVQDNFLPKKKQKEIVEYAPLSGNDVIMPTSTYKEPSNGAITIINVLLGVVIGAALIWFLIIPAKYRGLTQEYNNSIQEYSEKLSSSNVEINEIERQLKAVEKERDELKARVEELSDEDGTNKNLSLLIAASNQYFAGKYIEAAEALKGISKDDLVSEASKKLYDTLSGATVRRAAGSLCNQGIQKYYESDMKTATDLLVRAYQLDDTRADALYYAGKAYEAAKDEANALKYYKIIVDKFENTGYFPEASAYVATHQ